MTIELKPTTRQEAELFVKTYHYSKIMPRLTKHWLGYYSSDKLLGIVTLGWGTQPLGTINKLFPNENLTSKNYFEIGKMAFIPEMNGEAHFGSKAMSLLVKYCKKNLEIDFIYTLADGIMGKAGYVYQASNFRYIGSFKTQVYMDNTTGEKIHPRSAKQLLIENQEFSGKSKLYWLTPSFLEHKNISKITGLMFRYIYPLNKKAKKILDTHFGKIKNPKDADLKWWKRENGVTIEISQPQFNMNVFNYNYQKN